MVLSYSVQCTYCLYLFKIIILLKSMHQQFRFIRISIIKFWKQKFEKYTLKLIKNHCSRLIFLYTMWLAIIRNFLLFTAFFFYYWKSSTRQTLTPYSRYRCAHLSLSLTLWCLLVPQKNNLCFLFRFIPRLL